MDTHATVFYPQSLGEARGLGYMFVGADDCFLYDRRRALRPYDVSISSLVDLCVRIVRELHVKGELSLEPEQLQKLLTTTDRSEIVRETRKRKT